MSFLLLRGIVFIVFCCNIKIPTHIASTITLHFSPVYNPRFSKQNMLLAGMWYAQEKPTMNMFLYPLICSLNALFKDGQ